MNLALFDFDNTITVRETFTEYIFYTQNWYKIITIGLALVPFVILYLLKILPASKMRSLIVYSYYRNSNKAALLDDGHKYMNEKILPLVRKEALERIMWHKSNNDTIVVVSASLDVYLKHWCEMHGIDLICSVLEDHDGITTGKLEYGDCSSQVKKREVMRRYDITKFDNIFAYGDSPEDLDMLSIANHKYYNWEKVSTTFPDSADTTQPM
jgi:phosphatidylglycerophosphatase C